MEVTSRLTGPSRIPEARTRPVFLLSSERSGSNLVRSILNTHSEVCAPHPIETAYPWQGLQSPADMPAGRRRALVRDILVNKRYSFHPLHVPVDLGRVVSLVESAERPSFLTVQQAIYEACAERTDASTWVTKYPGLWDCLDEIGEHYQAPKFVYLVRDPRDVVLSFKTSNIELYHPYLSSHRWLDEQRRGRELLGASPDSVHLLTYEALLQDPESEVRDMCEFLDVPFEEAMLYYYETEDAQATSESSELLENLSIPIQRDNFGKFRDQLPEDEVALTEKVTYDELVYFGYEPVNTEERLDEFTLEPERTYGRLDRELARAAGRRHWREAPGEQVRRHLTTSFTAYMYLRYGVIGGSRG